MSIVVKSVAIANAINTHLQKRRQNFGWFKNETIRSIFNKVKEALKLIKREVIWQ